VKFAFVTPRYGEEIVGGAEMAARMIAERLVAQLDWNVEIYTTRAKDIVTWDNEYPEGDETINGVLVHRFEVVSGRDPHFFRFSERLLSAPDAATEAEARAFVDTQGPGSPGLIEALRECDRDLIAFYPYLYTPTVDGVAAVGDRAVMHPAAHDEPALHLPVFRRTMTHVQGGTWFSVSSRWGTFHRPSSGSVSTNPKPRWVPGLLRESCSGSGTGRMSCASAGWTASRERRLWPPSSPPTRRGTRGRSRSHWSDR
jgi:hypothetical protein